MAAAAAAAARERCSKFCDFEHTHGNRIPIGDYTTFNLVKNQCIFILFWKKAVV